MLVYLQVLHALMYDIHACVHGRVYTRGSYVHIYTQHTARMSIHTRMQAVCMPYIRACMQCMWSVRA